MLPDVFGCAAEPIRIPGAIQPHGWLVVAGSERLDVVAYSENCATLTQQVPGPALVAALQRLLQNVPAARVLPGRPAWLGSVHFEGQDLEVSAHSAGTLALYEFEPVCTLPQADAPLHAIAHTFLAAAREAGNVRDLLAVAAAEMKRITGYGRCLIYSFDADGHGSVIVESAEPGYQSYLGHSFPASDIPAQARQLYLSNHIRVIPDAQYVPSALHAVDAQSVSKPIDLSFAHLRSISPVHIEYMRNMGTMASMSVSLVVRGRLWGMISCHNHAPRGLDIRARLACEHLGQLLSLMIETREDSLDMVMRHEQRGLTMEIVSRLGYSEATLSNLIDESGRLLELTDSSGVAVVFADGCWMAGMTPPLEHILALAEWISRKDADIYRTDHLPGTSAPKPTTPSDITGLLAITLSRAPRHVVLWFRPECQRSVRWVGEPAKAVDAHGRLHPRRSFRSWEEVVEGRSAPWSSGQVGGAVELRRALLDVVLQRVRERTDAAARFGRVSNARDVAEQSDSAKTRFLAILSHELRTPLASIAYAARLLGSNAVIPEAFRNLVPMIERNVAVEARLVDDLFDMSAIAAGKLPLAFETVRMDALLAQVLEVLAADVAAKSLQMQVAHGTNLAPVRADPVRMQQVLWNILRNAVKFTPAGGRIEVRTGMENGNYVLSCKDSGIGIDARVIDSIFIAFGQGDADTHHQFGGLGLGLAIASGIVHGHGGTISVKSAGTGLGATFIVSVPATADG